MINELITQLEEVELRVSQKELQENQKQIRNEQFEAWNKMLQDELDKLEALKRLVNSEVKIVWEEKENK